MCEKTLFREFSQGLTEVNYNFQNAEVLNFNDDSNVERVVDAMDVRVVDFYSFLGASIERNDNRATGLYEMSHGRKNLRAFIPENVSWGDKLPMNMQILVRIESNIKLNLFTQEGQALIEDPAETEVHYMQLEAMQTAYTIAFPTFFKELWRERRNKMPVFKNWTITDFDHCLRGNPLLDKRID